MKIAKNAIIAIETLLIIAIVVRGNTIEAFGIALILGLIFGVLIGASFRFGEEGSNL